MHHYRCDFSNEPRISENKRVPSGASAMSDKHSLIRLICIQ
jgi:hypothetical protein